MFNSNNDYVILDHDTYNNLMRELKKGEGYRRKLAVLTTGLVVHFIWKHKMKRYKEEMEENCY